MFFEGTSFCHGSCHVESGLAETPVVAARRLSCSSKFDNITVARLGEEGREREGIRIIVTWFSSMGTDGSILLSCPFLNEDDGCVFSFWEFTWLLEQNSLILPQRYACALMEQISK